MFLIYLYLHRYQQKSLYVLVLESTVKRKVMCSKKLFICVFNIFVHISYQWFIPATQLHLSLFTPGTTFLELMSFGCNSISTISLVYLGSIYKQNTTATFLQYNTPLLYFHSLNGRIIFLLEVKNRMASTASRLWHLSDAKLTHIFNHRFLQDRSW